MKQNFLFLCLFLFVAALSAQAQQGSAMAKSADARKINSPDAHDPVAVKVGDTYYLFTTGFGISVLSSKDLVSFSIERPVFQTPPAWAVEAVKGYRGHTWAPDIIKRGDTYYLYYSVSAFAKNTSCIGVASNKTLDPESADFKWVDHGKVIESIPNRDMWNAIDPNIIIDEQGKAWMTFGSFWGGIKLVQLSDDMLSIAEPQKWYSLVRRDRKPEEKDTDPGSGAVEAPFIFKHGDYYYLFVSFDYCCRGVNSDYKVVVGRSKDVRGPYVDREGKDMMSGGATLVVEGNAQYAGVGHNSVYTFDGKDVMFMHGYDNNANGRPKLLVREIVWDSEDWPTVKL